ncbi:hypothetical protein ACM66B_005382 [Microbotryomycetes sp. NB124-2]
MRFLGVTSLLFSISLSSKLAAGSLASNDNDLATQQQKSQVWVEGLLRNVNFNQMTGIVEWDGPLSSQVPILKTTMNRVRATRAEESEGDEVEAEDEEDEDEVEGGTDTLFDVAGTVYTVGEDEVVQREERRVERATEGENEPLVKRDTFESNEHVHGLEKRRRRKHHHKGGNKGGKTAVITWYTGQDLKNPSCGRTSGWTPTDNSLVTAPTLQWGANRPPCGAFIQLRAPNSNRAVIVRVWDSCGGCAPHVPHLDLSTRAFKALYPIDVGKVKGVQWSYVGQPFKKWGRQQVAMYGPKKQ